MDFDVLSMYPCLQGLEPADFFHWFGRISAIPRGSHKEQLFARFLLDFAAQRKLEATIDAVGNVLMRVPATTGYETQAPILFQAHMDMVWEKDVEFDFTTQPIDLCVQADRLTARGTTLGADNAVGLATMLALADGNYPHPALELLFTTAEEDGMVGIRNFDMSQLQARRMINMDCGDSHVLCISSAGKAAGNIRHSFPLCPIPQDFSGWKVEISGGLGGHGGICANKGRCCAANAIGDLLATLGDFRLYGLRGSKSIMKCATALIAAPAETPEVLRSRFETIARVYAQTDPDIQLTVTGCALPSQAPNATDSRRMAQVLQLLRAGQWRADGNAPQHIVTLGILSHVALSEGAFEMDYLVRSTTSADQLLQFERCAAIVSLLGMELVLGDSYSGTPERVHSPFRDKFQRIHKSLFGAEMELERCPGGIETGFVVDQLPDMDAIGVAPTARGAHTTNEYLFLDEVAPYWQLITAVLAEKDGE